MKKITALIMITIIILCSCSISGGEKKAVADFFSMDTYMSVTAYGDEAQSAVDAAKKRIEELDSLLNAEDKNSEIFRLNSDGKVVLGENSFELVTLALEYSSLTDGAFNPALHPLSELWGFIDKKYRVPDKKEITDALKLSDTENIIPNKKNKTVKLLKSGMEIDLGGIAKGYAAAEAARVMSGYNISGAIINLGGNVRTVGKKPDGSLWNVAIKNPVGDGYLANVKTTDKAVVTSGGYERYFEKNGRTYHHILNPDNGYPADSGLKSVTIISDNDTLADALSTALFVMGEKKAERFYKKSKLGFDFILLTDDDRLICSKGAADILSSDYEINVIE